MCGRYARRSTQKILASWFRALAENMPEFEPTFNAAPQSMQPILRLDRDSGAREFLLARWGLVPSWSKDAKIGYSTINARAEELLRKPTFRNAFLKRRCLVPADAFYEWKRIGAKTKQPYAFALRSGEPYAFAGLWESSKQNDGPPLASFTIVTTDPNEAMAPVHDRMPVIIPQRDYDRWLEPGDPERPPVDLLRPYPADEMRVWPVSERVGNARNDNAELLDEAQPIMQQPGLFD